MGKISLFTLFSSATIIDMSQRDHCYHCKTALEKRPFTFDVELDGKVFSYTDDHGAPQCPNCRHVYFTLNEGQRYEVNIARKIIASEETPSGNALRYIRRAIGVGKEEWARSLFVDEELIEALERGNGRMTEELRDAIASYLAGWLGAAESAN